MKSVEFSDRLHKAARLLEAGNGGAGAQALKTLAEIFAVLPDKKVADVVKVIDAIKVPDASFMQPSLKTTAELMSGLKDLLSGVAAKGLLNDIDLLHAVLGRHQRASLGAFVAIATQALSAAPTRPTRSAKPLRADLVERYNRRLEQALGDDDGFRDVYAQLESDPEMTAPELSALAKQFALASAKARGSALKKIFARHQALMISRAASAATSGRIAG